MGQAHDGPGAFDQHQSWEVTPSAVVEAVEEVFFRHPAGKLPLSVAGDRLWIKAPSGVAEGLPGGVVQAHPETAGEKAAAVIGTGLKACGRGRGNPLVGEPG